jgi:hypothetical protein
VAFENIGEAVLESSDDDIAGFKVDYRFVREVSYQVDI